MLTLPMWRSRWTIFLIHNAIHIYPMLTNLFLMFYDRRQCWHKEKSHQRQRQIRSLDNKRATHSVRSQGIKQPMATSNMFTGNKHSVKSPGSPRPPESPASADHLNHRVHQVHLNHLVHQDRLNHLVHQTQLSKEALP